MVNNSDFAKRLQKIINENDENASSFAEKIGVQRSSISHVLSGRNKPSLDFVLKVLKAYPEVNLYWLLNGKGDPNIPHENAATNPPPEKGKNLSPIPAPDKDIERIVIFFKDGSFKSYE
jgi:transcriptional regulator with XRE-family HTH domain